MMKLKLWRMAGCLAIFIALGAVSHADVIVTPKGLEEKVRDYILDSTPFEETDAKLDVEMVRLPSEAITLKGETLTWLFSDSRVTPLAFRTVVQVTLSTEAETRKIGIPVRLSIEKPVWVATRLIRAREAVKPGDAMLVTKRLDHDALYALGASEKITAYTSRINIEPGTVLDSRKVSQTPAVYRNDQVHMIMAMPSGVQVAVYGKALEDGAIGKRIRVSQRMKNNRTQVYTAEVIGKNTVKVHL